MAVRLAWGVVAERDRKAWVAESGEPIDPRAQDLSEGAAVVLGPRDSEFPHIDAARAELNRLVAAGGVVIAGAGIDLGNGFISARLAGAGGDRRDAVLAALRVLGMAGAPRLGERAATLVALFGVTATKPVGAAAERAIAEERWAALALASAAADVLGPEQLEQVLGFDVPAGIDPIPGAAVSALAVNLRTLLGQYSRTRRSALLADLWQRVCDRQSEARRRRELLAGQDFEVESRLSARYRKHAEERLVRLAQRNDKYPLSMFDALCFVPTWENMWKHRAEWLIEDAIAVTVLLRTAFAVHEYGVAEGVSRMREQFAAASALMSNSDLKRARRQEPGDIELPARPGCYVREIESWLRRQPMNAAFEPFLRARLHYASVYAAIIDTACHEALCNQMPRDDLPERWTSAALTAWRDKVGYTEIRPPDHWRQVPVLRGATDDDCLARRRAADPAAVDQPSDMLWYAELADAMLRMRGFERAEIRFEYGFPHFEPNPEPPRPDPLVPRADSVPLAVAGAAQLLSLGASAPPRCRDWASLCAGLLTSGTIAAALTSEFQVPEAVIAWDGAGLPDSAVRIELARNGGHLAEWSAYMGNCIAGQWYQDEAARGRSVLVALRDAENVIVVNAELRRTGHGWFVDEIKGRFNAEPDPELKKAVQRWALTLRAAEPESEPEPVVSEEAGRVRRSRPNPVREIAPDLYAATRIALAAAQPALRVLAAVAGDPGGDPKTLTGLRRSSIDRLTRHTVDALDTGRVTLPQLFAATGTHPLTAAVASLDPAVPARYPRLLSLSEDAPLPSKTLRAFVKEPGMATARSQEILAHRLRAVLARLCGDAHPALTRALVAHPDTATVCALAQAITCAYDYPERTVAVSEPRAATVPGFPASSLSDPAGPWQLAWPEAVTLGAEKERFWDRIADTGLLVPAAWLNTGGWQGLWSRAAAGTRSR